MLLPSDEVIEGVVGSKIEFEIALVDENDRPVDTTQFDRYKICIPKSKTEALEITQAGTGNGSTIVKVGSPTAGVFKVTVSPLDSALITPGQGLTIELVLSVVADPANIIKHQIPERLTIFKSLC